MDQERDQYLDQARRICARQESCKQELRRKLYRKGCPRNQIEGILEDLEEEGSIDEERFVELYIRDKFMGKSWGRLRIREGLKQKGIDEERIEEGLNGMDEKQEDRILRKFLAKKWREELRKGKDAPRNRTIAAAERKGHPLPMILGLMEKASGPDGLDGIHPGGQESGEEPG